VGSLKHEAEAGKSQVDGAACGLSCRAVQPGVEVCRPLKIEQGIGQVFEIAKG